MSPNKGFTINTGNAIAIYTFDAVYTKSESVFEKNSKSINKTESTTNVKMRDQNDTFNGCLKNLFIVISFTFSIDAIVIFYHIIQNNIFSKT